MQKREKGEGGEVGNVKNKVERGIVGEYDGGHKGRGSERGEVPRHLKELFGVLFIIQAQQSDDDNSVAGGESKILLSRVEAEYTNINKSMV